jgi:hypothetical protein
MMVVDEQHYLNVRPSDFGDRAPGSERVVQVLLVDETCAAYLREGDPNRSIQKSFATGAASVSQTPLGTKLQSGSTIYEKQPSA